MKIKLKVPSQILIGILLTINILTANAAGEINSDPAASHSAFKSHSLVFQLPNDGMPREQVESEEFYAVILRSAEICGIDEQERLEVQKLFPENKVFVNRFQCDDDVEENIYYTNVNQKVAFIAVYSGATRKQAQEMLEKINASRTFAGANIRKMKAVFVYP